MRTWTGKKGNANQHLWSTGSFPRSLSCNITTLLCIDVCTKQIDHPHHHLPAFFQHPLAPFSHRFLRPPRRFLGRRPSHSQPRPRRGAGEARRRAHRSRWDLRPPHLAALLALTEPASDRVTRAAVRGRAGVEGGTATAGRRSVGQDRGDTGQPRMNEQNKLYQARRST